MKHPCYVVSGEATLQPRSVLKNLHSLLLHDMASIWVMMLLTCVFVAKMKTQRDEVIQLVS